MRSASTTKEDDQDITESIVGILDSDIKLQNQQVHESSTLTSADSCMKNDNILSEKEKNEAEN